MLWSTLLMDVPEMTDSFQPSKSMGRPEVLEKHWSSRTFSLFSSASFLGQSDPPPPTQPPPREDVCWFSELQERERRPSEHHSLGGEPCSHPSCTLRGEEGDKAVSGLLVADQLSCVFLKTLAHSPLLPVLGSKGPLQFLHNAARGHGGVHHIT